jgi:hypothetical protein
VGRGEQACFQERVFEIAHQYVRHVTSKLRANFRRRMRNCVLKSVQSCGRGGKLSGRVKKVGEGVVRLVPSCLLVKCQTWIWQEWD